jgi:hypothetical protein
MPNNHHAWNQITKTGNPTRAKCILNLSVKKKETRHQGIPSQARRPLTQNEFRSAVSVAQTHNHHLVRIGISALTSFLTAMISRVDDATATQWKKEHYKAHTLFPTFAAQARLNWPKECQ